MPDIFHLLNETKRELIFDQGDEYVAVCHIDVDQSEGDITANRVKKELTWRRDCQCEHDCCGHTFAADCLTVAKVLPSYYIAVVRFYRNV